MQYYFGRAEVHLEFDLAFVATVPKHFEIDLHIFHRVPLAGPAEDPGNISVFQTLIIIVLRHAAALAL